MTEGVTAQIIYLGLLLVALGGWVFVEYRGRMAFALRTALAWGMIFLGVAAGYGLWGDLRRGAAQQVVGDSSVAIPRAADGHYYPIVTVNGRAITFMADTGASGIVLSQEDARDLGIDPETLAYLGSANTANGTVRTARVRLDTVEFGPFRDAGVAAYVTDGQMEGSLLGMDYLGRFSVQISGEEMVLTR